jgi:hypothetical protein
MAAADQVLTAGLSMVSVLVGYGAKMGQDWWTAKRARQQLHLPLLAAARELGARLSELAAVYGGTSPGSFTPESLSRDFRELYLLRPDELPDRDGALLSADDNEPRRNDRAVQDLRKRMCYELNFATSPVPLLRHRERQARRAARAGPLRRQGAPRGAGHHRCAGPAGGAAGRDLRVELGPPAPEPPQSAAACSARSRPSRISSSPNAYSFP